MTKQQIAKRWIALGQKWEGARHGLCVCGVSECAASAPPPEVGFSCGVCWSDEKLPDEEYERLEQLFRPRKTDDGYYWPQTEDGAKDRAIACYLMAETVGDPT